MLNTEDNVNRILDIIEPRLNIIGPITTKEVYQLCKKQFGYTLVSDAFLRIMQIMIKQKKAVKDSNGHFTILTPDQPRTTHVPALR